MDKTTISDKKAKSQMEELLETSLSWGKFRVLRPLMAQPLVLTEVWKRAKESGSTKPSQLKAALSLSTNDSIPLSTNDSVQVRQQPSQLSPLQRLEIAIDLLSPEKIKAIIEAGLKDAEANRLAGKFLYRLKGLAWDKKDALTKAYTAIKEATIQ